MSRLDDIEARLAQTEARGFEVTTLDNRQVRHLLTIARAAERYCTLPDGHEELFESYLALRAAIKPDTQDP